MKAIIYKWNKVNKDSEISSRQVASTFIGSESEDWYKKGGNFNNCLWQHLTEKYDQPTFESPSIQEKFFDAIGKDYQNQVMSLNK